MYELISIVACPAAELQLELAMNLRKVSQCQEKAPTRASAKIINDRWFG